MSNQQSLSSTGQELLIIQAKLEILRKQEAQYETLIQQLKGLKSSVNEEMKSLDEKQKELEATLIPANWLPNELLGRIFQFVVEGELSGDATSAIHHPHAPISVSHVNQRWRATALSTPCVWSHIHLRGRWNAERIRIFLSRSRCASLDIHYRSSPDLLRNEEIRRVHALFNLIQGNLHRLKRIDLNTKTPDAIAPFIEMLQDPGRKLTELASLSLSIMSFDPNFVTLDSILDNDRLDLVPKPRTPSWSHLQHLKLEEIPLFRIPPHLIANLISFELTCPPRNTRPARRRYCLHLSALMTFLSLATSLEELTLNNTVPVFDVTFPNDNAASTLPLLPTPPIRLTRLKAITWTFPLSADIHRFLSFVECPALEKLDLWVETQCLKEHYALPAGIQLTLPAVIDFPAVRELCFQCTADMTSSLYKFLFPNIEQLDISHVVSKNDGKATPNSPMSFPRLESIFRDPRLFNLTHLTLSHFEFTTEHRRREAVLGYMPALVFLSLESCVGVGNLIKVLGERFSSLNLPVANRLSPSGGVKVCPRLEALSFWGCDDLRIGSLLSIVLARNGDASGPELDEPGLSGECVSDNNPHEASQRTSAGITGAEFKGNWGASPGSGTGVMGRKIKPLRKSAARRASSLVAGHDHGPRVREILDPFSAGAYYAPFMAHEVSVPSPIVYARFHECALIRSQDALALKHLGVTDVVWLGDA